MRGLSHIPAVNLASLEKAGGTLLGVLVSQYTYASACWLMRDAHLAACDPRSVQLHTSLMS